MDSENSYRNPFSDYNANAMDSSKILDFWCSPFRFAQSASISESDIYQYEMPIIFMGGRGTGKTMFLKYFSYETQRDEAFRVSPNNSRDPVMSYLKSRGGIGFYLRFDGPVLRSFKGRGVDEDKWDAIFTHYFELQVCKCYIKVIQDLLNRDRILKDKVEKGFIAEVARCFGKETAKLNTIEDILKKVEGELQEVISFRAQIAFSDVDFCPSKGFGSQDLSFRVAEIAKEKIGEFREDINFVILIDEYENFLERQQRIVNTLLKFVRPGVTFRIGMRLEGFHTFGTISDNEFIKEGRDYTKIIFEDFLTKDKEYRNFLRNVARKRLEAVPIFRNKGFLNISKFLGSKENLEEEACTLVEGRKNRHFESLDQATNKISVKEAKDAISCPDNPLLEMLNILWVLRGNEPDDIHNVMKDYLNGEKTEKVNKYRRDYIDKYKLSLMFLLASIYRANKKYYSFNTFCFISSGIVGHFIELCRRSFQYAYFENRETLLSEGEILKDLQNRAARDLANSEFEMIKPIHKHGERLYSFAKNLGSIFREYHKDPLIRYPETNQFTLDIYSVQDETLRDSFRAALEWSIIQKKSGLQQSSPGTPREEIYTLNRIFSPIFEITYRTRGGYSESFDASDLEILMTQNNVKPKMKLKKKYKDKRQQHLNLKYK